MARKNYSDEFRRQAVELYESTPGASVKGIAADLGVERATLALWLDKLGTGTRTTPDGVRTRSPRPARAPRPTLGEVPGPDETPEQRLARLEAENKALRTEKTKVETERLPVRRRPLRHDLPPPPGVDGEAAVRTAGRATFLVLRLARRRTGPGRPHRR
jgi:transposase